MLQETVKQRVRDRERGRTFCLRTQKDREKVIDAVNAALYLRRPLLVTGRPGSGKTSLAYAIAYELKLGPVLTWSITTRSTLKEGLYDYDAITRLQEAQLNQPQVTQQLYEAFAKLQGLQPGQSVSPDAGSATLPDPYSNIGEYIRLGPLATAFLPTPYPRVLLIDEIDKSDINLPNDLLNLLEEGEVEIPELRRLAKRDSQPVKVRTADGLEVPIAGGKIPCQSFPMIVMTSNGERDFPPAFLRRCLRVIMPKPTKEDLEGIVKAHLGEDIMQQFADVADLIEEFASKSQSEAASRATDQLLNAVYLRTRNAKAQDLEQLLFAPLTNTDENG
jgi:MoxR-like ATPase